GAGNSWNQSRVASLRSHHRIPIFDRETDKGARLTIAGAASDLWVSARTVRRMIAMGLLPASQPVPYAPWAIQREALGADSVQRAVQAVKRGRKLPRTASEGQLDLMNSRT